MKGGNGGKGDSSFLSRTGIQRSLEEFIGGVDYNTNANPNPENDAMTAAVDAAVESRAVIAKRRQDPNFLNLYAQMLGLTHKAYTYEELKQEELKQEELKQEELKQQILPAERKQESTATANKKKKMPPRTHAHAFNGSGNSCDDSCNSQRENSAVSYDLEMEMEAAGFASGTLDTTLADAKEEQQRQATWRALGKFEAECHESPDKELSIYSVSYSDDEDEPELSTAAAPQRGQIDPRVDRATSGGVSPIRHPVTPHPNALHDYALRAHKGSANWRRPSHAAGVSGGRSTENKR